jgi:glycosyltransferase involved in cell wall biosynthesis
MHVALDARLAYYTPGGITQYTLGLATALAKVAPEHRFTLLRSFRQGGGLGVPRARNLGAAPLLTPPHHRLEQLVLPLEVARLRPDVLHCPDFIPPLRRPFPAVVTVHDLGFLRFPETLTAESRRYYGQVGRAVGSAERTIAVSQHTARDLAELLDAPADRVRVVHNGVDPTFRPIEDAATLGAMRDRHRLDRPYVLFVGTLEPRKNLGTLIRAFRALRARHDVTLALVGRRGWLDQPTFDLIDELGLGPHVRHVGELRREELPTIYSGAFAFSLPSLYEGFGLTALEAMACGTPTVVADTSSLPEVVGDAALLVEPDDVDAIAAALVTLVGDEVVRRRLVDAGVARAAAYTWERAAAGLTEVYRRLGSAA